ncbi:MAG TPA: hopanoid-associated sugar epimerase [Magnetospirillaceae bacterium]|jgi:dihydroflavonol-4-reductase
MSKPILVTGATGFVGAAVVRALLAKGHKVRALVRQESDRRNILGLNIETVSGRLEDAESLELAVQGCEALFHVAADYRLWVRDPKAMLKANVDGTRALMQAAIRAKLSRVVYTSSVAALGHMVDGKPADETTPSGLNDMVGPYKRSKFLAEAEVRRMVAEEGLPAVIVNPSTPIGPRDVKPTPTGKIIVMAASGKMPAYVDTGLNVVHVEDVAEGHLRAFERGKIGERYILGGENLTLAEILKRVAHLVKRQPPTIELDRSLVYPVAVVSEAWARISGKEPIATLDGLRMSKWKMWFSCAKAERELGYIHRPAEQALADAVAWFRDEGYLR